MHLLDKTFELLFIWQNFLIAKSTASKIFKSLLTGNKETFWMEEGLTPSKLGEQF